MQRYNPKELEPKWQKVWQDTKIYQTKKDDSRPKKYIIDMFPYPSGAAMHVGHVRNFTISDVLSQYHRQKGYNVLHTMGWDTFGLPAENYAIKTGTPPAISTKANIANFKSQLTALGMSYDWNREITTSEPEYYKWTQWIFTKLHEKGLAYQAERAQWWCNTDKTVLANEQVEAGKCWRCGNEVVKKSLNQWFFKITDYAEQLLEGIDDLDWPEKIKTMQRNWIGKSIGAEIGFKIDGSDQTITVFTTRPDTLFGATFMVLAPEHPLVGQLTDENEKPKVESYIKLTAQKSDVERQETDREKTGVFTGSCAINPINNEKIPIWIADYVLSGYGTGAIMAVPAHDDRDYAFALKFEIPVVRVIDPVTGEKQNDPVSKQKIVCVVQNENGEILTIKWKPELGGRLLVGGGIEEGEEPSATAKREIAEETGYTDVELVEVGDETVFHEYYAFSKKMPVRAVTRLVYYKLKSDAQIDTAHEATEKNNFVVEWVKPEQAYQEIHDDQHLRALDRFIFNRVYTAEGLMANSGKYNGLPSSEAREKIVDDLAKQNAGKERVNYKIRDWLISRQRYWGTPIPIIHCPDHGAVSVPQKDLPVILPEVKSFEPTGDGSALASVSEWVNTTCPTCGGPAKRETDTMDGYACSSWYFLRYADANNAKQAWDPNIANYWLPIDYYCGGDHAVSHLLYSRFWMYFFADQGLIEKSRREPVGKLVYNGYILSHDGQKMSKSKGNVINPDELISQGYGADSLRLFEMFIAPYEQNTNWNTNGVPGTFRFLQRFWTLTHEFLDAPKDDVTDEAVLKTAHHAIARVSSHLDNLVFNNAVSTLMESVNNLYKLKAKTNYSGTSSWQFALEAITKLLAPFAPHISEELWQQLGKEGSVHISNWPVHDSKYLSSDTMTIVVQVNGKVRGQIVMPTESTEEQVIEHAKANEKVASYLDGQSVKKTIYVPVKLVNFVI